MAKKAEADPPRLGLFVEGTNLSTPHGRDSLRELWRDQCAKVCQLPRERIDVYGFSKQQLLLMHPNYPGEKWAKVRLDVHIEQKHKAKPFHWLVVAFDAHPADAAITLQEGVPCLRLERDFLLDHFAASDRLPPPFRAGAQRLRAHFEGHRGQPRAIGRPPIGDVEIVYMDPMFESLVLQDASALRAVFGLKSVPKTWPKLPFADGRPDFALRDIVNAHRAHGPHYLQVQYDADKHAWAHEVLRNAAAGSPIWQHPILHRLGKALAGLG